MTTRIEETATRREAGAPPRLDAFAHVSLPCRDLAEGKLFYGEVLGGTLRVDTPTFASFRLAGVDVGIGTEGCTWIGPGAYFDLELQPGSGGDVREVPLISMFAAIGFLVGGPAGFLIGAKYLSTHLSSWS